jgi:MATE family multidrug resistance protein
MKLAFPLILSNMFWTMQLTIDRILLSQYSSEAVAACLAAVMLFAVPFLLLQITAAFATTFVAQYVGAGRPERVGPVINQELYFSVIAGIAFLGLIPLAEPLVAWVGHSESLQVLEATYFRILAFATLPMLILAVVTAFFAGRDDSWTVLWFSAIGMIVNAVLDWFWIFGRGGFPEGGIAGAGWATVLGSWASALVALGCMWRPALRRQFGLWTGWRLDAKLLGRLLWYGVPSGLQAAMDTSLWAGFLLMTGWLGGHYLAASSIVFTINGAFLIPMLGVGQAVSVLVGQRLGQNRPDLAEQVAWIGAAIAGAYMTTMGVLLAFTPDLFLFLFASDTNPQEWEAVSAVVRNLLYFVAIYSFFDSMNIMLTFALRGAGDTRFVTLLTVLLGSVLMVLPAYYVCQQGWGVYWCWGIATGYLMVQCAAFTARFIWGPWRSMRVIEPKPADLAESPSAATMAVTPVFVERREIVELPS